MYAAMGDAGNLNKTKYTDHFSKDSDLKYKCRE